MPMLEPSSAGLIISGKPSWARRQIVLIGNQREARRRQTERLQHQLVRYLSMRSPNRAHRCRCRADR